MNGLCNIIFSLYVRLGLLFIIVSLAFDFFFLVIAKRLAGKSQVSPKLTKRPILCCVGH